MEITENKTLLKTSAKYFGLTVLWLASIFCVALLVIPVLSPKTAVNAYKKVGLSKAAVGVCERQYEKSKKIEDLYNLVLICDQVGNSEKLLSYSSELLSRDDFASFEKAFNEYALKNADKDKLYLVASLRNYLNEIRIGFKYSQSTEKAFQDAITCFEKNDINIFYFSKYIDCILDGNSSLQNKKLALSQTANATIGGKKVIAFVQERYENFKPANLDDADLLLLEQLWQTKRVEVVLLEATDDAELEAARTELSNLATLIEAKINND